ncbi:hypothetical protein [Bradyrhizobium sp. 76]|uniref:hypothetical protein n=1 Tax=Bradyrhizobium sp. 76 TaxID=2782680 RepID=UPI001FFA5694|nr:hypothetical protein [Bradyrhizobium sp. 76]MCK1406632.1 hypothetical protein [Bradyrhizobium sp. 76]
MDFLNHPAAPSISQDQHPINSCFARRRKRLFRQIENSGMVSPGQRGLQAEYALASKALSGFFAEQLPSSQAIVRYAWLKVAIFGLRKR